MPKAYVTAATNANLQGASSCRRSEAGLQTNSIVMRAVQAFWPTKTMIELRGATGASERMIQYWLANKYALSAADLAKLLRTDAGLAILESIMAGSRPTWWKRFKRSSQLAALRAEQERQRKQIAQLELEFGE
jgi:hypothetical protein